MISQLAKELEKQYTDLNFRNHCYLRIAYDNVVGAKWDTLIKKPFTNNAHILHLNSAKRLLILYTAEKDLLLQHNKISLTYRKK